MNEQLIQEIHDKFPKKIVGFPCSGFNPLPEDIISVIEAAMDGWFTEGKRCEEFGDLLKSFIGMRHVTLCNSGSSATLVAIAALKEYYNNVSGRKVITCAVGFPTTVSSILQNGLVPSFVDAGTRTLNADEDQVIHLLEQDRKVVGVVLTHMLGFPFNAQRIQEACKSRGVWFIEDCCDALGATWEDKKVGSFGDASVYSFFPAHHVSTGEGGAILCSDGRLHKIIQSYVNWGRDCWCKPGESNTCNKRFEWNFPDLPDEWDHKYTFTRLGYNLKMTELQAALGIPQMKRVKKICETRLLNFWSLIEIVRLTDFITSPISYYFQTGRNTVASPFGFPIVVHPNKYFSKQDLVHYLETYMISTRPMFGGNITRQPAFSSAWWNYVSSFPLDRSNYIMDNGFWIGCQPGLENKLEYIKSTFDNFMLWKVY